MPSNKAALAVNEGVLCVRVVGLDTAGAGEFLDLQAPARSRIIAAEQSYVVADLACTLSFSNCWQLSQLSLWGGRRVRDAG